MEVAKGFGANAIVQSICEDDYAPAIDAIVDRIAPNLSAQCLEQGLERNSKGLVACDVIWELPPARDAPVGTPTECGLQSGFGFLQPLPARALQRSAKGGARCGVFQLPIRQGVAGALGPVPTDDGDTMGWYYDDFSREDEATCKTGPRSQIMFTTDARPPTGVRVVLDCAPDAEL
ncbi:MAG TPA: hypothetical protein VK509_00050 [Polyangiales bacterium]|nr:hypothetical protein [Polyangiales bacterium]